MQNRHPRRDELHKATELGTTSMFAGAAGVTFFMLHLIACLQAGEGIRALWACQIASLLVGSGMLLQRPSIVGIGVLWLLAGTPLWCVYLAIGQPFHPTSVLTHLGGLFVGCYSLKMLGMPRGLWWKALAGLCPLLGLSRLISPPELNINLAWHVYQRTEPFPGFYPASLILLSLGALLLFHAAECWFRHMPHSGRSV